MEPNEYQRLAARTIRCSDPLDMGRHGALGLCAELEELEDAIYWHETDKGKEHLIKELGDVWWMVAEICTSQGFDLNRYMTPFPTHEDAIPIACKISGIFQKTYQGHPIDTVKLNTLLFELVSRVQGVAEIFMISDSKAWQENIEKLKKRYPDGFEAERSLHRSADDQ